VDLDAEATAITMWASQVLGTEVVPDDVLPLLAGAGVTEPADDFVEETVVRLLSLLNLPIPADFPGVA